MITPADRLHLLYELNRGLTGLTDLGDLLNYVTRRARELFNAEGCALLLLDPERHEFYFPIASENESYAASAARLRQIRFPADQGIAGWVLQHDRAEIVADAASDPRFYRGIDDQTQMTTRALLCAPLRTPWGNIGVIEVVNPAALALSGGDLEFLETLAGDVAVACERALLYGSLRDEVRGLRRTLRVAGYGLIAIGGLFIVGAVVGHLAWALPLRELPTRPGVLMGVVGAVVGTLLVAVGKGRLLLRQRPPGS